MIDTKKMIEELIYDLANSVETKQITCKLQVVARLLNNETFSNWVNKEFIKGYETEDILPLYRKIQAINIKASYVAPQGYGSAIKYTKVSIPIQNLGSDKYHKIVNIDVKDTVSIIEQSVSPEDNIYYGLSPQDKLYVQELLGYCQILETYKEVSKQSFLKIIETSKSVLIDILMGLNEELFNNEIDYNIMNRKDKDNVINHIYASNIHTGTGNIEANNSNNIGGSNNEIKITSGQRSDIEDILNQIEVIKQDIHEDEKETAQYIFDIRQELEKENPSTKFIKKTLRCLKTFTAIAAQECIKLGLDKIINSIS